MRGYYKNPEATAEVVATGPDGKRMFRTGDLGRFTEDGFVQVTGRLKELYKLENGKYVCPTPIEETLSMSRFITQVVLTGANRPYNVALIVPDTAALRTALELSDAENESVSDDDLLMRPDVHELVTQDVAAKCANMKKFEIPQKWAFVPAFTAANDMLTPKMSIRRHKVISTYADLTERLYNGSSASGESASSSSGEDAKQAA